ncbi:DUF6506 family protein [Pseudonocardia acaciae]|uniref:DUF6506 family protein n=1 Tax=Pseudonocardia acaciae TaxID=551276 RepID=UPI00049014C1|nr:DUF6506 family protein [Pseudonocardia acaciae]
MLHRWGFVYLSPGTDPTRTVADSGDRVAVLVGVPTVEDAPAAARALVTEGAQLVELCGGFGPVHTARVIEAIDDAVPVGAVSYGPEATDRLHEIFGG